MHETQGVGLRKRPVGVGCHIPLVGVLVLFISFFAGSLPAQTVTGQISGTVTDSSGAVIPGAKVTLTYNLTEQTRDFVTDNSGVFVFPELVPGSYQVAIKATGFQPYTQKDIVVGASERVALHEIGLTIGSQTVEVTVTANESHVQTDSSDHSGLLTEEQYQNVPARGRNYLDYLRLLPGVTANGTGTDAPGWSSGAVTFNGGNGEVVMQLDGITSMDTGQTQATGYISPSVDAIQEVRVQAGNVNAEYGSRAGGTVNIVIRNGTPQFHGSAYEFLRNNFFNANSYFSKLSTNPAISGHPAPYKFNNFGGTIGGPVVIPGVRFNKNRDKLFFFFSADYIRRNEITIGSATAPSNMTTPTPAERAGMFYGLTGALQHLPAGSTCTAYSGGQACILPAASANAAGTAIMKMLPMPTCLRPMDTAAALPAAITAANASLASLPACANNNANYNAQIGTPHPWDNDILRVDYNLAPNELWYVRLIKNYEQDNFGFLGGSGNWPQLINLYTIHSSGAVSTLVSTIRPSLVNEFTVGTNRALQEVGIAPSVLKANQRSPNGLGPTVLPVLFPSGGPGTPQKPGVNPLDLIPTIAFGNGGGAGGTPLGPDLNNAPNFALDGSNRFPFFGTDTTYNVTDNMSWIKGTHNVKFGIYFEKTSRNTQRASQFHGNLSFGVSSLNGGAYLNPLDTGDSFSNAYLGVLNNYTESDSRPVGHGRYHQVEWFAQDTWKATRRLTLDYGVRFQLVSPDTVSNQTVAAFVPAGASTNGGVGSAYSAAAQPGLIKPCKSGGQNLGCESNGTVVPAGAVGLFDPTTPGTPYQGMVKYSNGSVINRPGVAIGPRVGFAYDPFGNGKTAIRGGFGIFYDRNGPTDGQIFVYLEGPPLINTPQVFNLNVNNITGGFIGPANVNGTVSNNSLPVTYQYNFGVQRDLGHGLLLDVSFVGNQLRHAFRNPNYNILPYGTNFLASSASPTGGVLAPTFLRPDLGYGNITYSTYDLNGNYNSLQSTVTKRFGRRLTLSGAWTWSRALDYTGLPAAYLGIPNRAFYAPNANDRRHNVKVNWTYTLPNGPFQNAVLKQATNGWGFSGIATFVSGAPGVVAAASGSGLSGSDAAPTRTNLTGSPIYAGYTPGGAGQGPVFLNLAAFSQPTGGAGICTNVYSTCGFGNGGRDEFYYPHTINFDMSLLKDFQLGKNEARSLQFRIETYNTFNHTEWGNPAGGSPLNTNIASPGTFGRVNNTFPSRIVVLALKLKF